MNYLAREKELLTMVGNEETLAVLAVLKLFKFALFFSYRTGTWKSLAFKVTLTNLQRIYRRTYQIIDF